MATEKYHKIQTIFKRDPENNHKTLLEGQYSLPELEYLAYCMWEFTEKVDGTNIRLSLDGRGAVIEGRGDNSDIPANLYAAIIEQVGPDKMIDVMGHTNFTLYGEGYGAGIQKGGGNYFDRPNFVLFDVKVGDWWLKREDVDAVANSLGIGSVPVIGIGTLYDAVEIARRGLQSTWGDFRAEGIVARPTTELRSRGGHRIITKIKCRDFDGQENI